MIPTKKQIQTWVNALRSGEYKQTRGRLQDEKGFCCLGVLCDITIPVDKRRLSLDEYLVGGEVANQRAAPDWAKNVNDDFYNKTRCRLPGLNDYDQLTFDEIADCLEAVYIHNVLD